MSLKGASTSAAFLLLLAALLLAPTWASAQPATTGSWFRPDCTTLTNPTTFGVASCWDTTANYLKGWDGTRWTAASATTINNVRDFGAKCDGATDDTTAFTNTVAGLPPTGGTVALPFGTCLVKNWTITKSNVTVRGASSGYIGAVGPSILRAPNGVLATDDVVRISGVNTTNVTLQDLQIAAAAPNASDRANAAVASNGTRVRLVHVILNESGTNWAFDNVVAGAVGDSTDSGGIYDSAISGKIRIKTSSFNVERTYFNGNGTATAIKVEGVSASTGIGGVRIAHNLFDSYTGPILDIGNTATQVIRGITVVGNRIGSGAVTGTAVSISDTTNGIESVAVLGNFIQAGAGATRCLALGGVNGALVAGNECSGSFSAGTGAPIVVTSGGAVAANLGIQNNNGGDVEYTGVRYPQDAFHLLANGLKVVGDLALGTTGTLTYSDSKKAISVGALAVPSLDTFDWLLLGASAIGAQEGTTGQMDVGYNWYYSGSFKYRLSSTAANLQFANGITTFQNAASGTADGALTWTNTGAIGLNGGWAIGTPTGSTLFAGNLNTASAILVNNQIVVSASGAHTNASVTFASGLLNTLTANGMMIYCSDCTAASALDQTCVGGGSGNLAVRINGVAKCAY